MKRNPSSSQKPISTLLCTIAPQRTWILSLRSNMLAVSFSSSLAPKINHFKCIHGIITLSGSLQLLPQRKSVQHARILSLRDKRSHDYHVIYSENLTHSSCSSFKMAGILVADGGRAFTIGSTVHGKKRTFIKKIRNNQITSFTKYDTKYQLMALAPLISSNWSSLRDSPLIGSFPVC